MNWLRDNKTYCRHIIYPLDGRNAALNFIDKYAGFSIIVKEVLY